MRTLSTLLLAALLCCGHASQAREVDAGSPDCRLVVRVACATDGAPTYAVSYDGRPLLEASRLGLITNFANLADSLRLTGWDSRPIDTVYTQTRIKRSQIHYRAIETVCHFENPQGRQLDVVFRISNNDIAFRYELPKPKGIGSAAVLEELTGFRFPEQTTTFLSPQSDPMIGWKRTKPSYEEEYVLDEAVGCPSKYGRGYTFPALFHVGEDWVLVSETGVDSRYCASHLSDAADRQYRIAFPMPGENNGSGTVEPYFALPGVTPWRTITVGNSLKPIVETTVPWDVVEPRYESTFDFRPGAGTWSWIVWQDNSMNYDDQVRFIDLASEMRLQYILIDAWWDANIGHERMEELIRYARSKNVDCFLWYSSSGYWNDIEQSPINRMDNPIIRKREMRWLQEQGVKGIKVDFFGGDKQETMRLYEAILSDADDHGLMVIFHGCTLPRGWERMYPNYAGSEAVLASENLIFAQHFCDYEAQNACLHPFIRNTVGCMEFGGCFLNKHLSKDNRRGTERRTSDVFQLATTVLFQNPIQNLAITPNNLTDAPAWALDFIKQVPTTWEDTRFIDGYPGKYVVLARRHGDDWYLAAVNASEQPVEVTILPEQLLDGKSYRTTHYTDTAAPQSYDRLPRKIDLKIAPQGGSILMFNRSNK